jgi:predicted oxidoreductase
VDSESGLRRSVDNINKHLRGTKKLDLFQCARVDPNVPVEESTRTLQKLIEEGKFDYIGMSEPTSAALRKAHAVSTLVRRVIQSLILGGSRFIPSWPWRSNSAPGHMGVKPRKVRQQLGPTCMMWYLLYPPVVIAASEELGIAVVGYSPLGGGLLTQGGDSRVNSNSFSGEVRNSHVRSRSIDQIPCGISRMTSVKVSQRLLSVRGSRQHSCALRGSGASVAMSCHSLVHR